jgi:LCP family protein required for cell wall assembly
MNKFIYPVLAIGVLLLTGAIFSYSIPYLPSKNLSWQNQQKSESATNLIKNIFSSNKISILILGNPGEINYQNQGGGNLTDTIMVAQFNPDSDKVYLISVPRDIWVLVGGEQMKINEVLAKYKANVIASKVEDITGVYLDGYVVVDLAMVKNAVDYFGGVDVILSRPAVDWVSGYTLDTGAHYLNGDDAVWLIRNRFDKEGDFFREKNQQQIINDLFSKFLKLSVSEKLAFIDKFILKSGLLEKSDLDASKLASYAINTDSSKVKLYGIVMDSSTKLFESKTIPVTFGTLTQNVSILLPTEGFEKYSDIRNYVKEQMSK